MDAECYFAQHMMRDRIAEVEASAELARLLRESDEHSRRCGCGIGGRLVEADRSLVTMARKAAFAISHALSNRTHSA